MNNTRSKVTSTSAAAGKAMVTILCSLKSNCLLTRFEPSLATGEPLHLFKERYEKTVRGGIKLFMVHLISLLLTLNMSTGHSETLKSVLDSSVVNLDRRLVDQELASVRALAAFPATKASADEEMMATVQQRFPRLIKKSFRWLNAFFFRNDSEFGLLPQLYIGSAHCDPHLKFVGMDPDFRTSAHADADQIDFVLAHELSHYVYETYLEQFGHGSSLNGNSSGYLKIVCPAHEQISCALAYARQHSEVDAIAVSALLQLGKSKKSIAKGFEFLRSMQIRDGFAVEGQEVADLSDAQVDTAVDFYIRLISAKSYLDRL